jgi:acyl-CoA thioesterase-1
MLRGFLFVLLFFSLLGFAYASTSTKKTLVIIGDSLTEGYGISPENAYPALIEKKLNESKINWKIINSGISGSTTASAQQRVKWALRGKPDMVLLSLGANDGLRGFKIEDIEKNLNQAIEILKKQKIPILLHQVFMPPNYGKQYTKDFSDIFPRVAKKNSIPLLPFLLKSVAGKKELNLADGIHPNENGHEIIAKEQFEELKKHLK